MRTHGANAAVPEGDGSEGRTGGAPVNLQTRAPPWRPTVSRRPNRWNAGPAGGGTDPIVGRMCGMYYNDWGKIWCMNYCNRCFEILNHLSPRPSIGQPLSPQNSCCSTVTMSWSEDKTKEMWTPTVTPEAHGNWHTLCHSTIGCKGPALVWIQLRNEIPHSVVLQTPAVPLGNEMWNAYCDGN